MDKNAIKKYAVWARRELIARVSQRAALYEITDKGYGDASADSVLGRVMSAEEKRQRQALIAQIREKGYAQVMEEIAYTWFNRFIALRFMEVNGYLPSHVRVFTDDENNFKPQILTEAIHMELDGLNMEKVYALKNANDDNTLFKYLIIVQCNALSGILPGMFQRIADYTELLFPDNLLREGSVIEQMVSMIPEEAWTDQVQIIGWLYQYYNTEPKAAVFDRPSGTKIKKEEIPAATQLFTPDWIVRYMVENSLGRLWVEGHPDAKEQLLPTEEEQSAYAAENRDPEDTKWHYYLEEAEQEPTVQAQLAEIREEYATLTPKDIKCIDPCCGSGHILVYMFDVLMQIYASYGYTAREAVASIIEHNLYGLDIDERATQLAYFSVMMKARQYDRRFFTRNLQPMVYSTAGDEDGENFGSLVAVDDPGEMSEDPQSIFDLPDYERRLNVWNYRYVLAQKYHVVCTNPPYMAVSNGNGALQNYVKKNFPDSKADLFAVFIERCGRMIVKNGYQAMITQHAWMFLSSFEKLRAKLMMTDTVNMAHLGARAFEEIGGEVVQTTSFVMRKSHIKDYKGTYCRLIEPNTQRGKEDMFLARQNCYTAQQDNFAKIPGSPVAYWATKAVLTAFTGRKISDIGQIAQGLITGDTNKFTRLWFEISKKRLYLKAKSAEDVLNRKAKWVPYNKGGDFRKWYGNNDYVVNWENNGYEIKHFTDGKGKLRSRPQGSNYYFKDIITWTKISSSKVAFRHKEAGHISSEAGMTIFVPNELQKYILAFCNSKVASSFLQMLSPTINCELGDIGKLPLVIKRDSMLKVYQVVSNAEEISKQDWNSFETSWDFKKHPLLDNISSDERETIVVRSNENGMYPDVDTEVYTSLKNAYHAWEKACNERSYQLKSNEEELNRIFIDIYGLQDELTPDVEDKDVTVHCIYDTKEDIPESLKGSSYVRTKKDEIVSLISYAVGCMFGRYSFYKDGLLFAGEPYSREKFIEKLNDKPGVVSEREVLRAYLNEGVILTEVFEPDRDNIIPICDDEYFEDDIVGRFVEFVRVVYGAETLDENLKFIANALGGKGQPKDVIRNYFLNDFYADHCKTYQKRPIYWLFDSGKKNGFKCLIYMHRYQPDTIARIRTDYVHEQQSRYRTAIADLEQRLANTSAGERVKLTKQMKKLQEQAEEIRVYEEKIHHLADQMIPIDLDDGVKVNYAKFQDVLAKIK